MVHSFLKTEKPGVVLNDLVKINQERIVCYQQSIDRSHTADTDLKHLFNDIIAESHFFKEQLYYKINEIDGHARDNVSISGLIHRAWLDLRINFTGNTRIAIINFCEYNEEVAQHAYKAALNISVGMGNDIYTLIEQQHTTLIHTTACIKKCHFTCHFSSPAMAYFN